MSEDFRNHATLSELAKGLGTDRRNLTRDLVDVPPIKNGSAHLYPVARSLRTLRNLEEEGLNDAKARKEEAHARKLEIANAIAEKEYRPVEEFEEFCERFMVKMLDILRESGLPPAKADDLLAIVKEFSESYESNN